MSQESSENIKRKVLKQIEATPEETEEYLNLLAQEYPDDSERVEIIILKYKNKDIEKECLNRLIDHTDYPFKLTLFDNRGMPKNTSKAWNKLIREATCEHVVVMDTDALVNTGWLEPLVEAMKNRDCAMAGPVAGRSTRIIEIQQRERGGDAPFAVPNHISGFCFITKKKIIEELGWFDEDFLIFGQDSDFCERIVEHPKYKCYVCPQSLVYHGRPDYENKREGSTETLEAGKNNEFNYTVDTGYAPRLVIEKKDARTRSRQ